MADEKLKDFGTLLKETMANRKEELPLSEETSAQISDSERAAVLEKVAKSNQKTSAQPPSAEATQAEDPSTVSFGVLLERTAKIQAEMKKTEHKEEDEIREAVIEKSKLNMVETIMRGLIH